ncbi:TPA: hypothetical protein LVM22_001058 [Klebsiella oxytoca]|nr:hypothetical protein [Klebsiella oxytoca]
MFKLEYIFLGLMSLLLLQGCSSSVERSSDSESVSPPMLTDTRSRDMTGSTETEKFSVCIFEAQSLLKMNKSKYASEVKILFDTINDAKYYSSISAKISKDVYGTLTPYYRFRINDICNNISHLILNEFKNGLDIPMK